MKLEELIVLRFESHFPTGASAFETEAATSHAYVRAHYPRTSCCAVLQQTPTIGKRGTSVALQGAYQYTLHLEQTRDNSASETLGDDAGLLYVARTSQQRKLQ